MHYEITSPEKLKILTRYSTYAFGGNQAWFPKSWQRLSGCGPTCGATITAYLAATRPSYAPLYDYESMNQQDFTKHMVTLFKHITPGPMGVNKAEKYINGLLVYASKQGISLEHDALVVDGAVRNRPLIELKKFLMTHLEQDRPIAFLNLDSGQTPNLQNWHWITITAVDIRDDQVIATASDEGRVRQFDLSIWYRTTGRHGGLLAFY